MKIIYIFLANFLWCLHFFIVVISLFGWMFLTLWPLYITTLFSVLVSNLYFNYCLVSKWEYDIRRKLNPDIEYNFSYTSYYTYKLTQGYLSPKFLRYIGIIFVSLSIGIWLYFKFWNKLILPCVLLIIPMSDYKKELASHILTTSANLVAVCLVIITGLNIGGLSKGTILDEVTSVASCLFLFSGGFAYLSMRHSVRRIALFRDIADYFFLAGITLMVIAMVSISLHLIH